MTTVVGPFLAASETLLPVTEFTLPSARTLGGAAGVLVADGEADACAVDDVDEDGADEFVDLVWVDVPQAASKRTVADAAASRAVCRRRRTGRQ